MSQHPLSRDRFRRPELFFQELLRKSAEGKLREKDDLQQFLFRALVIAVDVYGGKLENEKGQGSLSHDVNGKKYSVSARIGPENPPNSIKARILTDGEDKFTTDENLRIFWPFFPENISVPIKPGEHVYVMFEDTQKMHGLWVAKVPGHVGVNYAPGSDFYKQTQSAPLSGMFDDTRSLNNDEKKFDKDEDAAEIKSGNKLSSLFSK